MQVCPYCKEEIKDDAVKCRYCGSFLASTGNSDQTTYILDRGLIRFGKFTLVILAMFLTVGAFSVPMSPSAARSMPQMWLC